MIGTNTSLRFRMGAHDARCPRDLVDRAAALFLFGDLAIEPSIRFHGDEGRGAPTSPSSSGSFE